MVASIRVNLKLKRISWILYYIST